MDAAQEDYRKALDRLFSLAYEELRRLAARVSQGDAAATLNPTALVNETWLKLAKDGSLPADSVLHFRHIAGRAMRQVLVDAARRRGTQKRSWGIEVPSDLLEEVPAAAPVLGASLLALDAALNDLAALDQRQASIVEMRFFGGFDINEIAAALQVSERTVLRDWRMARAWLGQTLRSS